MFILLEYYYTILYGTTLLALRREMILRLAQAPNYNYILPFLYSTNVLLQYYTLPYDTTSTATPSPSHQPPPPRTQGPASRSELSRIVAVLPREADARRAAGSLDTLLREVGVREARGGQARIHSRIVSSNLK